MRWTTVVRVRVRVVRVRMIHEVLQLLLIVRTTQQSSTHDRATMGRGIAEMCKCIEFLRNLDDSLPTPFSSLSFILTRLIGAALGIRMDVAHK